MCMAQTLRGGFTTEWEYEQVLELRGKTLHVWSCEHKEGYRAFQLTHQPADSTLSFVKPRGTGHWTSLEGFSERLGIPMSMLKGCER